jgi:hypothetical protein
MDFILNEMVTTELQIGATFAPEILKHDKDGNKNEKFYANRSARTAGAEDNSMH